MYFSTTLSLSCVINYPPHPAPPKKIRKERRDEEKRHKFDSLVVECWLSSAGGPGFNPHQRGYKNGTSSSLV